MVSVTALPHILSFFPLLSGYTMKLEPHQASVEFARELKTPR